MIIREKLKKLSQEKLTKEIIKDPLYIECGNDFYSLYFIVKCTNEKVDFVTVTKNPSKTIRITWKDTLINPEYRLDFSNLVKEIFEY